MQVQALFLKDAFLITPEIYGDERGFFYEFYKRKDFEKATGLQIDFIQDNFAKSHKGSLRGLHFQTGDDAQAKLVSVIKGSVLDVIVDIRKNSATFGQHYAVVLDSIKKQQLFIPRGFAHGYLCLENDTLFYYKIDNDYKPESEAGIRYNDPDLHIDWNIEPDNIILSEKDKNQPFLKDILHLL